MERTTHLRMTELLRSELAGDGAEEKAPFTVSAAAYRDRAVFEQEQQALFRGPRIIAASASLANGSCMPYDAPGLAALVTRASDGVVHASVNACRHRGTRLVDAPCQAKAFVCPYHGWTYDLAGSLIHLPHADAFAGIDPATRGLRPVPVTERHGLVWLGSDIDGYLGELGADVAALDFSRHVMWNRSRTTRRCNWKLVIEAFLDGYHIRVLHRDSVYRFFLDAASVAEPVGPHIRAVTGRRLLREAPADLGDVDLRLLGTPSLVLFPSTVIVEHPDFISIMTVHPLAADETAWDHMMMIPADRAGEVDHWSKSWSLIEDGVFQGEDLRMCEQAQRSIMAGATDEMLFGSLEFPVTWFHQAIARAL